jgi:site-specific recombinase XerD
LWEQSLTEIVSMGLALAASIGPRMIHTVFRAGEPYLFGAGWKTLVEANDWLYSVRCEESSRSPGTWRVYAYALADYLAWCEKGQIDWRKTKRVELDGYLHSLDVADDTLNHRIAILARFYTWCVSQGLAYVSPFQFRETFVRRPGFLSGSITRRVMRPTVMRRVVKNEKVSVPSAREVWTLHAAMNSWKDQLMVETVAYTGLRCSELLDLRLEPFLTAQLSGDQASLMVKIMGKGRKVRPVPFPAALVRNLRRYAVLERKHAPGAGENDHLFLSARGKPLRPSGAQYVFRCASARAGVAVHPHLLRHFFACHRLKYLTGLGLGDPLGQLQRELGHSQITTTTRYLHLTDEMRARIASDHQTFIASIARGERFLGRDDAAIESQAMKRELHGH